LKKKLKKEIVNSTKVLENEAMERKQELFYHERLKSDYFKSLQEKSMPNQAEVINQDY
jgi:DNA-directed RNA polymerase subunit F